MPNREATGVDSRNATTADSPDARQETTVVDIREAAANSPERWIRTLNGPEYSERA